MKKGFTLIELIITMGLISVIGSILISNMSSMFIKEQDNEYERFKKTISEAACTYMDMSMAASLKNTCVSSGSANVPISTLLGTGLISEANLINPNNNTKISSSLNVSVTCSNGVKTCSLDL